MIEKYVDKHMELGTAYLYERVPNIYGKNYYVWWKKENLVFEIYDTPPYRGKLLEIFLPQEVKKMINKFLLRADVLEFYLKQHLMAVALINENTRLSIFEVLDKENFLEYEKNITAWGIEICNIIEKTIKKSKFKVINGND